MRILIVDDEQDIVGLIAEEFVLRGHDTLSAYSGNEAIKILKSDTVDVVISDFKMANGNGLEILKFVNTLGDRPKFIFISGQSDLSDNDCLEAGAQFVFPKPFDLERLVEAVELKTT